MLDSYKITDTLERLYFRNIREECIITDTHLAAIIGVTGANLFEKKEEDATAYLLAFVNVLNQLSLPIQLVTHSRPKRFDEHIAQIKREYKKNDFHLEFEKDLEWFELYYEKDLIAGKVTQEQIRKKFEASPNIMRRSMLDSYVERIDAAVKNNKILEKTYFFVISTLDEPSGVNEKEEQDYMRINFENDQAFRQGADKLNERVKKAIDLLKKAGMNPERFNDSALENVLFDVFNFPLSTQHKILPEFTEYLEVPPILEKGDISPREEIKKGVEKYINYSEKVANGILKQFELKYGTKNTERDKKESNPIVQLLKPSAIDDSNLSYTKINDQYLYTIHIDYFGQEYLEDLVLWPILTMEYYYDLSVHLIPLNKEKMLEEFKRRIDRIEQDYQEKSKKVNKNKAQVLKDEAQTNINRINTLEADLKISKAMVWSTSIDITFRASNLEELSDMKEKVSRKLISRQIVFSEATGNHYEGFISTAPLLTNLVS